MFGASRVFSQSVSSDSVIVKLHMVGVLLSVYWYSIFSKSKESSLALQARPSKADYTRMITTKKNKDIPSIMG